MLKKIGIFLGACAGILMVFGTAMAVPYAVKFDPDAGGSAVAQDIWGYQLTAYGTESIDGNLYHIVTHQSLGIDDTLNNGDTFEERMTVIVNNGLGAPTAYNPVFPAYNGLNIELSLGGSVANYSDGGTPTTASNATTSLLDDTYTTLFTSGSGAMYVDANGNFLKDPGELTIASFAFDSSSPFNLNPDVFGSIASTTLSVAFKNTFMDAAYFSTATGMADLQTNIANGFLFTTTLGTVSWQSLAGDTSTDPDQILLGWQQTGIQAKFDAVPEPSSVLLLGSGLVGLALLGRKRLSRKN